jgi:predicted permease
MSFMLADVIFPAFTTPYISPFLFPVAGIAAIGTEFFCYRHFSNHPARPNLGDIILANCASWFVGVVISFFLPSGLVDKIVPSHHTVITQGPHFTTFAIVAFFVACLLSIVIEFWMLRFCTRNEKVEKLFYLSAIANTAGYVVLGILVWIWVAWI